MQKVLETIVANRNPQIMAILSAMLQQSQTIVQSTAGKSTSIDNAAALLQAQLHALLGAKQKPEEILAQYQLALNNSLSSHHPKVPRLTKDLSHAGGKIGKKIKKPTVSSAGTSKVLSSSLRSSVSSVPSTSSSGVKSTTHLVSPKDSSRPKGHGSSQGNDKINKALEAINGALSTANKAITSAIEYSKQQHELEKKRAEVQGLPTPLRKLRWTERLRSGIKQLVMVLFTNLEECGGKSSSLNSTVLQYLYNNIRPALKAYISFEDLLKEIAQLIPERDDLRICSGAKMLIERDASDRIHPPNNSDLTRNSKQTKSPNENSTTDGGTTHMREQTKNFDFVDENKTCHLENASASTHSSDISTSPSTSLSDHSVNPITREYCLHVERNNLSNISNPSKESETREQSCKHSKAVGNEAELKERIKEPKLSPQDYKMKNQVDQGPMLPLKHVNEMKNRPLSTTAHSDCTNDAMKDEDQFLKATPSDGDMEQWDFKKLQIGTSKSSRSSDPIDSPSKSRRNSVSFNDDKLGRLDPLSNETGLTNIREGQTLGDALQELDKMKNDH
ncbi:hypothetical protein AB6A40_008104 [Gnathostoma spinigerum]|uniref:Uncharacterized protein n=1 Tax=Gnathostoma spinigerum TaxID=75299 RepID=A0ABD6EN45_9BILA